ncbi:hypothetical protein BGZ94_006047 [Podila epigama]|nr:hypothetical protein BGZ94_006047 [Podila epigama]
MLAPTPTEPAPVPAPEPTPYGVEMPLMEVIQSLLYLPQLVMLELSACGLNQSHCALLSRTLTMGDSRITHLNIHNNWLGDEGLAELLWAVGPHLFSLDVRHCGFGNASAFALASVLEAQAKAMATNSLGRDSMNMSTTLTTTPTRGQGAQSTTLKILKLQESQLEPTDSVPSNNPYYKNRRQSLDIYGRQNLVRALESIAPLELMVSMEMGFEDEDFASAFAGMRRLECLEWLEVAHSNFGPLALAAMERTLRATSCRIRYLGIRSTLLTVEEQKLAIDTIMNL